MHNPFKLKYPIRIALTIEDLDVDMAEQFAKACPRTKIGFLSFEDYMIARWIYRLQKDGVLNRVGEYHLEIKSRTRAAGHWCEAHQMPSHPIERVEAIIDRSGVPQHLPN